MINKKQESLQGCRTTCFYIFAFFKPMTFFKFLFSKSFLVQLCLAVVAVVVISFIMLEWLEYSTKQGQTITVPDLSRMSLERVDARLAQLELRREILDSANYNPDYPPFSVIEQVPRAGKEVKENRKIYLTINPSGFRKVEIPDLIRKTRRQVVPTLRSLGFEIGKITYEPDDAKDAVLELRHNGKVLEPGTRLTKTSTIDLVLGDGTGRPEDEEKITAEEQIMNELESEDYDF